MLFFVVSIIEFDLVTLTACMFFSFFLLQRQSTLQILTSGSGTPAKTIHYFVSHITLFLIFRSILQFFFFDNPFTITYVGLFVLWLFLIERWA